MARYRLIFRGKLEEIDRETDDSRHRLRDYAQLYLDAMRDDDRMCLCGMLASDIATLPEEVRHGAVDFFADNEAWLAKTLDEGRKAGTLSFKGSAKSEPQFFVTGL